MHDSTAPATESVHSENASPEPARARTPSPSEPETNSARSTVLGRVRSALSDRPPAPEVVRDYRTSTEPDVDVLSLFGERAAEYEATVHRVPAPDLPGTIADILAAHRAGDLAIPVDIPNEWLGAVEIPVRPDSEPLSVADLNGMSATLTGCAVAIAETGTIVLDAGTAQGRRLLTLLPDVHLCVVLQDQVVGTVPEAVARLSPTRPQTWISGPSATSDIELQRVEGVHGPRNLHIIVVEYPDE